MLPVRTTVRLDDNLYRAAKARAAETGRSVGEVIEDALRVALAERRAEQAKRLPALPVFGGSGTLPGVDLSSNATVLEALDEGASLDALH
jgi:plasmid stability protein